MLMNWGKPACPQVLSLHLREGTATGYSNTEHPPGWPLAPAIFQPCWQQIFSLWHDLLMWLLLGQGGGVVAGGTVF